MKHEIEIYKGQTIFYDEDSDKFVCDVTVEEKYGTKTRKSLKDIKREIDLFIKANLEFKPFKCIYKYHNELRIRECTALRVDGKLVIDGWHIEQKNWDTIYQYSPSFEQAVKEAQDEFDIAYKKKIQAIKEAESKLVPMNLDKYKSNQ